ncbi:unnamed protein product [Effrenium voratum]|uniref:CRAL-TRIO domain-containing protein n=1 Tax=Effrenium voratum TaxID=2562239 RepID=A0AA36JBS2_9DINO|nr:unnamed protein product [Effrenium voratum]
MVDSAQIAVSPMFDGVEPPAEPPADFVAEPPADFGAEGWSQDCSLPSEEELKQAEQIRKECAVQIGGLKDSPRDVVGDIRISRFLRFHGGDVDKATKSFGDFLAWREREKIDELRKDVIDLPPKQFIKWLESVMSPFSPILVPGFHETEEGHYVVFFAPGYFKAHEFVHKRPECQPLETDLLIMRVAMEYVMKQVDDNSYKKQKMCYSIKLIDAEHLGRDSLPIFVPQLRKLAQENLGNAMNFYCEQDILTLVVNAPWTVRFIMSFVSAFMTPRQLNRIKVFSNTVATEAQAAQEFLRAIGPESTFPSSLGGDRAPEDIPFYQPMLFENVRRVQQWMLRRTPGITCPKLGEESLSTGPPESESEMPAGTPEEPIHLMIESPRASRRSWFCACAAE